jgi:hypothetical protein
MNHAFLVPFHVAGTLAANVTFYFTAPFDMQLIHAQAVASNASNALITIGTSSDADGYLTSKDVGDSAVPGEWDRDDFAGALVSPTQQYPHIADGTIVEVFVDYDGASGTAAQNLTVVLTFTEG